MATENIDLKAKFDRLISKYGASYPDDTYDYILYNLEYDTRFEEVNDVMYQVYTELSLVPRKNNRYFGFLNSLNKHFDINSNILEVAGGFFPVFAKELSSKQKHGSVTVYDPNLVTNNLGKLKLIKEPFGLDHNVDKFDLMIGISPCESTPLIIKKANEAHKEFFLALCGCDHSPYGDFYGYSYNNWEAYVYGLIEGSIESDANITTTYLNDRYEYPYPVLIKKYKK